MGPAKQWGQQSMAGVPASENSPAVAEEPVQADLHFNFNILFFQSTRIYNKGKLNTKPAAYCLAR